MTLQGRVQNGVVVLTNGASLPDGTLVNVVPVDETAAAPSTITPGQKPPHPVSKEQKEALLGLIGMWKMDHPPDDEEVERIIEEHRMKKYGVLWSHYWSH
jgi:hypothetical protein